MLKTYTVEKVRIEYDGEEVYNGEVCEMPTLEDLAEDLALEFYGDEAEDIPDEEFNAKCIEILIQLQENAEYYEDEEIDGNYYIQQEYYLSIL